MEGEMDVLIVGAGVAGEALALALARSSARVTVVERAEALRDGGHAVDFRGPVHRAVLDALNLWQPIADRRTRPGPLRFVGPNGEARATLPAVLMAGDVEILRGDLVRLLHERVGDRAEHRFGDRVTAIEPRGDRVDVTFARGGGGSYDLVVGADGLHSAVRDGISDAALRHHGYRIASFSLAGWPTEPLGADVHTEPGRAAGVFRTDRGARAMLVYRGGPLAPDAHRDIDGLKRGLAAAFDGHGWLAPGILSALDGADDLYVDAIATVHADRYSAGRVALLGDAAWGGTLGGQGTSLAIVGAWVLAGELGRADRPQDALVRYEAAMRPYATRCQGGAARVGGFFAPRTALGVWARDRMYGLLGARPLVGLLERLVKDAATDFDLPRYA